MLRRWSERWAELLLARAGAVAVACALVTIVAGVCATKLSISTDLASLLPSGYPSVRDLHRLHARIGGSATLTATVESPELRANERFADALVVKLREALGDDLLYIDYKVDAIRDFYERHAAVYLPLPELQQIERDLDEASTRAKLRASPLPYELELDEPRAGPEASLDDIEKRLDKADRAFDSHPDGYYAGEGGRFLAVFLRPSSSGADSRVVRAFIARVQRVVDEVGPSRYHPAMKIGYTGAYQISLDEEAAIRRDLLETAALCVGLIAASVLIYFRRVRVLLLLGATLVCGCVWAFGLAWLTIGFLNVQTAFLGSIIAGTGINYGIILLSRYLEARRAGEPVPSALEIAGRTTLVATATAAIATAVSFGTMLTTRISSFKHFAVIGGGGILFCWALSYTLLPALLILWERRWPMPPARARGREGWTARVASFAMARPAVVIAIAILGTGVAAVRFVRFFPDLLESDGRNFRSRSSGTSGAAKLDERVAALRGESLTPAFVVTESLEESARVCEVLNAQARRDGTAAALDSCKSIYSLLPEQQEEKLVLARRLLGKLDALPADAFSAATRKRITALRERIVLEPVGLAQLPAEVIRPFRERSGEIGRIVAVYPASGRDLWIAKNLYDFADAIRKIDLGDGRAVSSSGDAVIFADILHEIARDAPRTTALSLIGVVLLVLVALRGGRGTLHIVGALCVGVIWMMGIAAAMRLKLNFFNFVALPTTFGIAVDYAINIYAGYQAGIGSPRKRMHDALCSTGGAVLLCSVTTIIGYATLIAADNLALVSFGRLAILGEACCIAASLLLLPATVLLDQRLR